MELKKNLEILIVSLLLFVLFLNSCVEESKSPDKPMEPELTEAQKDSIFEAEQIVKYDIFPEIEYKLVKIDNYKKLQEIRKQYTYKMGKMSPRKILMTLNRKEFRFFRIGEFVIIPDSIITNQMAYSIFPQYYHGAREIEKLILVSNKYQCYGCYDNGVLVRFAAVNSGKERTPTFPGRYAMVWKEKDRHSSLDSNWHMPYTWNFHAAAGNAFHKFTMPGRPVSHSCVRQFMSDAEWLFYWAKGARRGTDGELEHLSGTPVIILDIFDFSRKKGGPWLELKSNKDNVIELPDNPMEVDEALIPWCQVPLMSRNADARKKFFYAEDTLRKRGIIREHVRLIETKNFNKIRRDKAKIELKKLEEETKEKEALLKRMKILEETFIESPKLDGRIKFEEKLKRINIEEIEPIENEEENKPPK